MTSRIVSTFNALAKLGDFSAARAGVGQPKEPDELDVEGQPDKTDSGKTVKPLRPEFHYNIQIHLPSNATEDVYLNIFNALRKTFQ
jgi:hypothetical protein